MLKSSIASPVSIILFSSCCLATDQQECNTDSSMPDGMNPIRATAKANAATLNGGKANAPTLHEIFRQYERSSNKCRDRQYGDKKLCYPIKEVIPAGKHQPQPQDDEADSRDYAHQKCKPSEARPIPAVVMAVAAMTITCTANVMSATSNRAKGPMRR